MKFRLFGGLDCPEAVLAQLSVASALPLPAVAKLVDFITNTMLSEPHGNMFEGVQAVLDNAELQAGAAEALRALQGNGPDAATAAAAPTAAQCREAVTQALCALHTVITCATRYNIDVGSSSTTTGGEKNSILVQELLMLGLSPEMTEVIRSGTEPYAASLRAALLKNTPRIARLEHVHVSVLKKQEGMLYVEGVPEEGEEEPATTTNAGGRAKIAASLVEGGSEWESVRLQAEVVRPHLIGSEGDRRSIAVDMSVGKAKALLAELLIARNRLRILEQQQ